LGVVGHQLTHIYKGFTLSSGLIKRCRIFTSAAYFGFICLYLPLLNLILRSAINLSSSFRLMFASSGLSTLPWGVPMSDLTRLPVSGSMYPAFRAFCINYRVMAHFTLFLTRSIMILWGDGVKTFGNVPLYYSWIVSIFPLEDRVLLKQIVLIFQVWNRGSQKKIRVIRSVLI